MKSLQQILYHSRPLLARAWHSLDELTGAASGARWAIQQPRSGNLEQLNVWENEGGRLRASVSRRRHRLTQDGRFAWLGLLFLLGVLAYAAAGALGWI